MEPQAIHVGIICDGNRRWAESHGKSRHKGHEYGFKAIKDEIIPALFDSEDPVVDELSLYVFSTENWNRDKKEVQALMRFARERIQDLVPEAIKRGIRLKHAGQREGLDEALLKVLDQAVAKTCQGTVGQINLCLNYGAAEERRQASVCASKAGRPGDIDDYLWITRQTDIIFRPGGEKRSSGFLSNQSDYAELIFRDTLLPDVTKETIKSVLQEFQQRPRRFGGNPSHKDQETGV